MISLPLFLTLVGFVILASGVGRVRKNSLVMACGIIIIAASIPFQVISASGVSSLIGGIALNFGVGLLALAAILKAKAMKVSPFLIIGSACLVLALITRVPALLAGGEATPSGSFLLELGPDDTIEEVLPVLTAYGATYEQAFPSVSFAQSEDLSKVYLIRGAKKILRKLMDLLLEDEENVDYAGLNFEVGLVPVIDGEVKHYRTADLLTDDPLAVQQWALAAAQINRAHALLKDSSPQRKAIVAILDTGVDAGHEDISSTFSESPAGTDRHGHGTHCAGIAGAATNNGTGIASLNWEGRFIDIKSYAALGETGIGTVESIAQAVIDATTDGADVISMSLGVQTQMVPKTIVDAVKFALRRDVIVLAAAGNSNQDARHHMPSNIDGVISVAAVDEKLRKASFSNTNTSLKRPIAAPGVNIMSLEPAGKYGSKSGTSMATPLVAGLVGVMRSMNPSITSEEAYAILHETGTEGLSLNQTGRVINAADAIQRALNSKREQGSAVVVR